MHDNCEGVPIAVPALTYAEDLLAIRALHEQEASSFYVLGFGHTVLRLGYEFTVVDGMLDGQIIHVGP
jgi:hypothetical protein